MTYGCGEITMKGALFKVNTDMAEAVRVEMPEPAELTDEVAVWREVPALSNGPRNYTRHHPNAAGRAGRQRSRSSDLAPATAAR